MTRTYKHHLELQHIMKLKKPNPLNFFGVRQTQYCPSHFEVLSLQQRYNMQSAVDKWICENLKNRYYLSRDQDRLKVGFEDPKEASYFMLACPHLKYK